MTDDPTRFESGGPHFPEEILAVAEVVASYGGDSFTHHGTDGYEREEEIDFIIGVAEETGMAAHTFHFKIRGRENWGTVGRYIDQIGEARARGLDVTANQYPYPALYHGWSAFSPLWAREGEPGAFAERLHDPEVWQRIRNDSTYQVWSDEHGSWEGIVLANSSNPEHTRYENMTVAEIARERGDADPGTTCIELMAEAGGSIGGIFFAMSEEDVREVMQVPWVAVAVATDGSAINLDAPGVPHPRNYGTNPRVLGH